MLPIPSRAYPTKNFDSLQPASTETTPAELIAPTDFPEPASSEPVLQEADLLPGYQYIVPPPEIFTPTELFQLAATGSRLVVREG